MLDQSRYVSTSSYYFVFIFNLPTLQNNIQCSYNIIIIINLLDLECGLVISYSFAGN